MTRADVTVETRVGTARHSGVELEQVYLIDAEPNLGQPVSDAFLAVLTASREVIHNEAFNVGQTEENYRIRDLAEIVRDIVPGSRIESGGAGTT